ncbi:MAG: hypothetical protein GX974_06355 [Clostridiales bacterium]|nr:hypothetical protein [Clostridiales bacterium]
MDKRYVIAMMIILIIIIGVIIYINIERADMLNTKEILVFERETENLYEIDDIEVIKEIVRYVIADESEGLDIEIKEPYAYALEFFTKEHGYGPLLCFKGLKICVFEGETAGNYIEVDEDFFELIEDAIK